VRKWIEIARRIVAEEERAELLAETIGARIEEELRRIIPKPKLLVPEVMFKEVTLPWEKMVRGVGVLRHFLIMSASSDYSLTIVKDGDVFSDGKWEWYEKYSPHVTEFYAAKTVEDMYVINIYSVPFSKSLFIQAKGTITAVIRLDYVVIPPKVLPIRL